MFDEPVSRRAKIIGGILLLVFIVAAAASLVLLGHGRGPKTPADIEALIERSPPDREAMEALKANYPADYRRLLEDAAQAGREHGQQAAAQEAALFMRRFIRSKLDAISAAPDRELQRMGGGQLELIQALREADVTLCARFAISGPPPGQRMPPGALPVLGRLSVYTIEAARAGEQPGRTPRTTLSDEDGRAWLAAMREIDPEVAREIETNTVERQPPAAQCRAGVVIYQAVTRLHGHASANVTAYLVRESINTTGSR